MSVGNVVFVDVNADGNLDFNEGWEGVLVQIFPQGAAVTSTPAGASVTDDKGRYRIIGLNPGNYFLHIPASHFTAGGVLANTLPMPTVVAGDDNSGQDLIFAATPATTGASTAVFTLTPGAQPVGAAEPGFEGLIDDASDSNGNMTFDLGLRSTSGSGFPLANRDRNASVLMLPVIPSANQTQAITYNIWKTSNPDTDGDLYAQLLEYALDTRPADGLSGAGKVTLESTLNGHADLVFTRPANGRADIRYDVEVSTNMTTWHKLTVAPQLSMGSDGRQIVRYVSINTATVFAAEVRGLVRLKVSLDADLDGNVEDSASSPVFMFSLESFLVGQRTFSMPLVNSELFAGNVTSSGSTLTLPVAVFVSGESYIEDLNTGAIYEINEAASTSTEIVLTRPPITALTRIALRAHHTLSSLLPEDAFTSGNSSDSADRVLTFDAASNTFVVTHLSSTGWMRGDIDVTKSILAPQSAVIVHARNAEVSVLLAGQVTDKMDLKPMNDTRFIGSSSVLDESAASMNLSAANGFRANVRSINATRLRLWKADSDTTQTGYDSLYLAPNQWQRQDDAAAKNLTHESLLSPFRGFFLIP
jgi:hypothetical protein